LERLEQANLAPYALKSGDSRGRHYPEDKHPYRTEFQRDRDRIVHSTAFRRLQYKTQVFVNHEGDHYRTRLTHTNEVATIARSISRALGLHEDLTEAIALAHDLGHTPFGHSGETTLNGFMEQFGGFEHNLQCIRVVDLLEQRYPEFPGLNLTFELREGILKHHSDYDHPNIPPDLQTGLGPSLECQVVNMADEIAYNCHDVDDGLASGLISEDQLSEITICSSHLEYIAKMYPDINSGTRRHVMVRGLINEFVTDLVIETSKLIQSKSIDNPDIVREKKYNLLKFSESINLKSRELKRFLGEYLYKHDKLIKAARNAETILSSLFKSYISDPETLPESFARRLNHDQLEIVVADYIAGIPKIIFRIYSSPFYIFNHKSEICGSITLDRKEYNSFFY